MSDNFEKLVDVDVTASDASSTLVEIIARFRKRGLITGELNKSCVLGGEGYLPGPAVPKLYNLHKGEGRFWKLLTRGVEPEIGRISNFGALGPSHEGFTCPSCRRLIVGDRPAFQENVGKALGEWTKESGPATVRCPECAAEHPITQWQCRPPLGLGQLAITFWNWPPFDSKSWRIDLTKYLQEITGHNIVRTWGHI
jgi:hypothetical protein